jgi:hypothetical protein
MALQSNVSETVFDSIIRVDVMSGTNHPTKKLTKGGVLRFAQDDDPCSVRLFLRTKHIAGTGEQCLVNYNWGCASANGFCCLGSRSWLVRIEGCWYWWEEAPTRQYVLCEKETLVGWISGDWTQKGWDRISLFASGPIGAETESDGLSSRSVSFFDQWEYIHKISQQSYVIVKQS